MEEKNLDEENADLTASVAAEETAATDAAATADGVPPAVESNEPAKLSGKQQFIQFLKFTAFSASAGVIQFLTITTLNEWTGWLPYWGAFPIGLFLSVVWNFTFNRKFTFKDAHNIKLAMALVVLYNCIIVVPLSIGGYELEKIWGTEWSMLITAINLLINFVTEFFWDKFVVFNKKANDKILRLFKKKDK